MQLLHFSLLYFGAMITKSAEQLAPEIDRWRDKEKKLVFVCDKVYECQLKYVNLLNVA